MKGALLEKLGIPKPADWGYQVSVCIVVEFREELICVTDNRASFGDFAGEHLTLKTGALWHGWDVMYAGDDVEHAPPIMLNAKNQLIAAASKLDRMLLPEEVTTIFDEAYSEHLQAQIEKKFLRKHGFNSESFPKVEGSDCIPEIWARVWDRIDKEKLSLRFLLFGHGPNDERYKGEAEIWVIDGENAPVSYNNIGFWSIGSGASAALNRIALYLSKHVEFNSLAEAIYVAITAKFAAELSGHAGRSTSAFVHRHISEENSTTFIPEVAIELMRHHWEEVGIPPAPSSIIAGLNKVLPKLKKLTTKEVEKWRKQKNKRRKSSQQPKDRK